MKKVLIVFILSLGLMVTSCEYDLDINTSPNSSQEAGPELRLPYILAESMDFYGSHGTRCAVLCQQLGYIYSPSARYFQMENWQFTNNADAWVWQSWYGYTWVNIDEMISDAEAEGAWHYVGVGKILQAFGCGVLVDAYGYIAYKEGLAGNIQPDYDDAEYVYSQVIPLFDEAIEDLEKEQEEGSPDLAEGDVVYNGDIDKWIKFAYGVKARMMLHLTKKTEGAGILNYNPNGILSALDKSFATNDDDFQYNYEESDISAKNAIQYQNTSSSYKPGKLWRNYLLNAVNTSDPSKADESWNSGIVDPRAEKLLPKITKGPLTGEYSKGIDLTLANSEPTSDDSTYVGVKSDEDNQLFYTQQNSPYFLLTYSEEKFIEAEVYFREGNKSSALSSYKDAIRANMDKLGVSSEKSAEFLASKAVAQSSSELTLSHIMIQKYIALTYSPEIWTDMRRCDYCIGVNGTYNEDEGVYKGFDRPKFVYETAFPSETDYIRRYQMAYYERYYNSAKVTELGVFDNDYMTLSVWWDIKE
jgi:hypothetical protein